MTTVSAAGGLLADRLTGRKVRGDSKLDGLRSGQQATLRFWLEDENRIYAQVVALVRTQFGVSVGKSAVGVYYQRHILVEQRDEELEAAAILAALPVEKFTPARINRAWYLAWSLHRLALPPPRSSPLFVTSVQSFIHSSSSLPSFLPDPGPARPS